MKKWNLGRLLAVVLVLGMVMSMTPALAANESANVVYRSGNIYTMDDSNPHATALAVKDGRLLYVGSDSGLPLHFMYHLPPLLSFFHSQKGPPQSRLALLRGLESCFGLTFEYQCGQIAEEN